MHQWGPTLLHLLDTVLIVFVLMDKYIIEQERYGVIQINRYPDNGEQRKFAQLYILDPDEASNQRMTLKENIQCNPHLMQELSNFFTTTVHLRKPAKCFIKWKKNALKVTMVIVQDRKSDMRRYNAPKCNEVAAIFQNAEGEPPLDRNLLIHCRRS